MDELRIASSLDRLSDRLSEALSAIHLGELVNELSAASVHELMELSAVSRASS